MTDFNISKTLSEVTIQDIQDGCAFQNGLANIIKWYLIGLYIRNDKLEIENLEKLFTKNASLYDKRAYKSEAKAVYKALKDQTISVCDDTGKALSLAELSKMQANEIKTSVGVLYKGLPKDAKPENPDKELNALAKQAVNSANIDTGGMTAKQLAQLAKDDNPFSELAKAVLEQAKNEQEFEAIKSQFPPVTSENLDDVATMVKAYITEFHLLYPEAFEAVTDHILALQTVPEAEKEAA